MASEQHCRCVPDSGRPPARLQLASGQPGALRSKSASARAKTRPILSMPISINQRAVSSRKRNDCFVIGSVIERLG